MKRITRRIPTFIVDFSNKVSIANDAERGTDIIVLCIIIQFVIGNSTERLSIESERLMY
jgi:hypothetical protein